MSLDWSANETIRGMLKVSPCHMHTDVFALPEGDLTLTWPAGGMSPESCDEVVAWLDLLKRKVVRYKRTLPTFPSPLRDDEPIEYPEGDWSRFSPKHRSERDPRLDVVEEGPPQKPEAP